MGTIRDLMIRLGVDADVDKGLGQAAKDVERSENSFKAAGVVLGAAIGAGITASFLSTLNVEAANDKLAAQLGATGPEAAKYGKAAGELYGKAYGESMGDVNDAIKSVVQNIDGMREASSEDLQGIAAKAMDVGKAFDQDIGQVSRAVGQMLKTGMATNAVEAFNILTVGFQNGSNAADDLLDTFNEYSTQFRELGLDGKDALGLITQGLQAGARDADTVADALKEYAIRAKDGSKSTIEAYTALGLGHKTMASDVAAGGDKARNALQQTLDALKGVKDPVERSMLAVQLFGTKAEDLGQALYALDPKSAVDALGSTAGAAEALGRTMQDNGAHKIEVMKRSLELMAQEAAGAVGPMGTAATAVVAFGAPALAVAGDIGSLAAGFGAMGIAALKSIGSVIVSFSTMVASATAATGSVVTSLIVQGSQWLWLGVQSTLHALKVAAAWLIAMGPIGLIVAAVIALVALIILNWDTISACIADAWEWIKEKSSVFWEWLKGIISAAGSFIADLFLNWTLPGLIIKHWESIKTAAKVAWDWVVARVKEAGQFILNIFLNWTLPGLIVKHWESIKTAAKLAWDWVVAKVKEAVIGIANGIAGIAAIPGRVGKWFDEMRLAAVNKAIDLVNWMRTLPSKIVAGLGNVGTMLYNSGRSVIQGLVNGIVSMAQQAYNSAAEVLNRIRSLFPFSPAKEGPFSGKGWVFNSGKSISVSFADGIKSQQGYMVKSASSVMDAVSGVFSTPLEPALGTLGYSPPMSPTVEGSGAQRASYDFQSASGSSGSGRTTNIENLNLYFSDDRDMYQKGAEFAEGLRAYKSAGGVIPNND